MLFINILKPVFSIFHNQNAFNGNIWVITVRNKQTLSSSPIIFFQAKSEPKSAAPSADPVLQSPQTSSSLDSIVTNTVRIEKLSNDEDEEVDITDDTSDDGDADNKPQAEVKTECCEVEQLTGTEIQTNSPTDEQKEGDQNETKDQHRHILLAPAQSPQTLSSLSCSEECAVTGLDEKSDQAESCILKNLEEEARSDSKQTTGASDDQCSQSVSSAETSQLEEACSDGTGTNHTLYATVMLLFLCEAPLVSYFSPRFSR